MGLRLKVIGPGPSGDLPVGPATARIEGFAARRACLVTAVPFERFLVAGCARAGKSGSDGAILATDWPAPLFCTYLTHRVHARDPVLLAGETADGVPVHTADIHRLAARQPALQPHLMALAAAGLHEILAIPVPLGRSTGVVALYRGAAPFTPRETRLAAVLAPAVHQAVSGVDGLEPAAPDLTRRERECLVLAARGRTAGEIGVRLAITERTAVAHLATAMRKLGASNRIEAVATAIHRGIIL